MNAAIENIENENYLFSYVTYPDEIELRLSLPPYFIGWFICREDLKRFSREDIGAIYKVTELLFRVQADRSKAKEAKEELIAWKEEHASSTEA